MIKILQCYMHLLLVQFVEDEENMYRRILFSILNPLNEHTSKEILEVAGEKSCLKKQSQ